MDQDVFKSIRYSAGCQDCGAELECWGVQALVHGSLRWDTEVRCAACRFTVAICGGELPVELRERLLAERGPARIWVNPSARSAAIMRVLRSELGVGLAEVKSLLGKVLAGAHSGRMPEMELLARKLRASGIDAVATRP
ncbi:hypothetical protein [Streptomyces odonnellii]|uniref:hypothetical protein n=1 Tax=Streptomyces odonnellii TaxID=1417980 RepID=UPI000625B385|nr:hypothetical protein [Streptomyces odonnellii]